MSATVKGLPELKAEFARVSRDVGKVVLRRGASAGARVVRAAILPLVPIKSGVLARSLLTKYVRERSNDKQSFYIVTFRRGKKLQVGAITHRKGKTFRRVLSQDAYYAPWVERGHKIVKRSRRIGTYRGKARYATTIASRRSGTSGRVPGKFFVKRAAASSAQGALTAMVSTMTAEINKALK